MQASKGNLHSVYILEEAARVYFILKEYVHSIEANKEALNIKSTGQDKNLSDIGLAYMYKGDFNEAIDNFK